MRRFSRIGLIPEAPPVDILCLDGLAEGSLAGHDPGRRRFVGGVAVLLGLAGAGAVGLIRFVGGAGDRPAPSTIPPTALDPPGTTVAVDSAATSTTTTTSPPAATPPPAPPPAAEIAVVCRDAWGALPAAGAFVAHEIERLTVHHTAALLETNSQAPGRIRQHQRYHLDRGWPDLAYHFVVDGAGNVYEGRPVDAVGDTATEYDPTGHFLVCCEGNFDEQDVPEPQLTALAAVLAWAAATYSVAPDTISGHRDWAATSCPGDLLYPVISSGELAGTVSSLLEMGGVTLAVVCGDAAAKRVAAIESGAA